MKRGRKTVHEFGPTVVKLDTTHARRSLTPVVPLAKLERTIFDLTVARNSHLKGADAVLLTTYAQAAARVLRPGKSKSDSDLDKLTRIMVLLGRSLRLTPQSTTDPHTVARLRRDATPNPLAEYLAERNAEQEATDDEAS
jgi:hypothetical protein